MSQTTSEDAPEPSITMELNARYSPSGRDSRRPFAGADESVPMTTLLAPSYVFTEKSALRFCNVLSGTSSVIQEKSRATMNVKTMTVHRPTAMRTSSNVKPRLSLKGVPFPRISLPFSIRSVRLRSSGSRRTIQRNRRRNPESERASRLRTPFLGVTFRPSRNYSPSLSSLSLRKDGKRRA